MLPIHNTMQTCDIVELKKIINAYHKLISEALVIATVVFHHVFTELAHLYWFKGHGGASEIRSAVFLNLHGELHLLLHASSRVPGQKLVDPGLLHLSRRNVEATIVQDLLGVVGGDLIVVEVPGEGGDWLATHCHLEHHTLPLHSNGVLGEVINSGLYSNVTEKHIIFSEVLLHELLQC